MTWQSLLLEVWALVEMKFCPDVIPYSFLFSADKGFSCLNLKRHLRNPSLLCQMFYNEVFTCYLAWPSYSRYDSFFNPLSQRRLTELV